MQRNALASLMIKCAAGVPAILFAGSTAFATCPIELAIYGDAQGGAETSGAEIDFMPAGTSATVTNTFRLILDNNVVLNGIVMWTQGAPRPNGSLMYRCPEGDATGQELAACTLWGGVIYTGDDKGTIGLLPAEGIEAPKTLVLADLGPVLRQSRAFGGGGFSKVPSDVFVLKGCQE
ncbi:hypothetical protein FJ958_04975 [Mesorhizobium sp. B2-3-5]|nr:hypothetical protein FJ958_04975 [Mesorhizobium sp. B2-3-5]